MEILAGQLMFGSIWGNGFFDQITPHPKLRLMFVPKNGHSCTESSKQLHAVGQNFKAVMMSHFNILKYQAYIDSETLSYNIIYYLLDHIRS